MSKELSRQRVSAATLMVVAVLLSYGLPAVADLTFSRTLWEFGSIEQGQTQTQKITLTNSGDEPVKIDKTELPECCSVSPGLANTEVKPKENLEVELKLDSKGILGQIQQYAYIFWSSSDQKKIATITIKGEVTEKGQPRMRAAPLTWDFGTVAVDEKRENTFRCENVGTAELEIEKVQIYDPRFEVVRNIPKDKLAPGEKVDFTVSVKGTYEGRCESDFYIKSNSAGGKFTKIGIKGYVVRKTTGLVVSEDFSSITNNTAARIEVTRTDNLGMSETITVERDGTKSFAREPGAAPTEGHPTDYTLTIKMVKPTVPVTKPEGEKVSPTEGGTPEGETKPAEEKPITAPAPGGEVPAPKPEEVEQPKQPDEKELKPAPPTPEKEEPKKPPEGPMPKPDEAKPSEGRAPSPQQPPAVQPEKALPPEESAGKDEKKPDEPEENKQLPSPAPPEKKESESPSQ